MTAEPVADYIVTPHAALQIGRRGIDMTVIHAIMTASEQRLQIGSGRAVLQSRVPFGSPAKIYVVRVFVDLHRSPAEVVTAYQSSKVARYWRQGT